MDRDTYQQIKGFSLIELSIVITLLMVLITGGIGFSLSRDYKARYDLTIKNLQLIEDALVIFVAMYGRLPCPASPSQSMLNTTFGVEKITSGTPGTPQSCNSTSSNINIYTGNLSSNTQYYGAPPVVTLRLPDEIMFDGWGNRIGYVVTKTFINNNLTNTSCTTSINAQYNNSSNTFFCYRGQASVGINDGSPPSNSSLIDYLQIVDTNSQSINHTISYNPAYVLISHGKNGYGAFAKDADVDLDGGGVNGNNQDRNPMPPSTNYFELVNLNCNPSTANCTNNGLTKEYVQDSIQSNFDDIIVFKSRNNLLLECNKYANNACTISGGIGAS